MKSRLVKVVVAMALMFGAGAAGAYTCEVEFSKADKVIEEAEAAIKRGTDARIKAMVAEAKGFLEAAKISHRKASERHVGDHGKYMHGDAVRRARWAQSLAAEAIFLATGEPR